MAWPSPVVAGQTATANQYNALVTAVQTWGGDVDAAGYALKNLGSLVINQNGSIDVSAGNFSIKGPVNLTGIEGNGVTATAGDAAAISLYTKSGQNPALVSSKSVVEVRSADPSRLIRLSAVPGQEEFIQAISGRLRLAGSVDIDTDAVLGGKLTAAAAQFTNAANLTFGSNWQNWTPTFGASAGMTLTGIAIIYARYLRIGPIILFALRINGTIGGTLGNYVSISGPPLGNAFPSNTVGTCLIQQAGILGGVLNIDNTPTLLCNLSTGANYISGSLILIVSGFYQA
jgi:hypothetical protein